MEASFIYKIFWLISFLVRSFAIPNPFESLQGETIEIVGIENPIIPEVINILFESLLALFTYKIVGFYYDKSERKPLKGSILYLFFYCVHTALIFVIVQFNFSALSITLVILIYIVVHILLTTITSKYRRFYTVSSY